MKLVCRKTHFEEGKAFCTRGEVYTGSISQAAQLGDGVASRPATVSSFIFWSDSFGGWVCAPLNWFEPRPE